MTNNGFKNYRIFVRDLFEKDNVKKCQKCGYESSIRYPRYRSDGVQFVKCPICGETIYLGKW